MVDRSCSAGAFSLLRDTLKPTSHPTFCSQGCSHAPRSQNTEMTMALVDRQLEAELRAWSQPVPIFPVTTRHCRNRRKGGRGFIQLPRSSLSLFSQDKTSAGSPCLAEGGTKVPLQPLKYALPCPLPQLRDAAPILTKKADDSLKKKRRKK